MKKYIFISIVVLTLAIAGGVLISRKQSVQKTDSKVEAANVIANNPAGPVKEFTVNGSNFAFDPATITVDKGDTVKINFKDDDGRHNLVVDGYNISTNVIGGGESDTITFVADKTGSFEFYCSVSNHRDLGMSGTLIVK